MRILSKLTYAAAIVVGIAFAPTAQALTITNNSPAWQLLPNSISPTGGTWGLPADLSGIGCGSENETTCEPTGNWTVDTTFAGLLIPGYYTITDADGTISDYVLVDNSGAGGTGQVSFYSDPNLSANLTGYTFLGDLCSEGGSGGTQVSGGCYDSFQLTLADTSVLTVTAASDGEEVFDPFGFGYDTSDDLQFTCEGECSLQDTTPIPGGLPLFVSGLGVLGLLGRRKKRKAKALVA